MALSLCNGGRHNSLWDPIWRESTWEPVELVHFSPSRSLAKRTRAVSPSHSLAKRARTVAGTKVDWLETDDAHVFRADLPGLKKEEIKVELEDDRILQIFGERSQEEEKKGDIWHIVERSRGKFLRRFTLPDIAQGDSVSAKVEDGVLTVTIPKTQPKSPETRSIEVVDFLASSLFM